MIKEDPLKIRNAAIPEKRLMASRYSVVSRSIVFPYMPKNPSIYRRTALHGP